MFGKIEGQRLHLAKMCIANYCIALEQQAGSVNVQHVVSSINDEFHLVDNKEAQLLVNDIISFYNCLVNQKTESIDRGNYWKWRAMSAFDAKAELSKELKALLQ
jgi:hypothetical protein